jgi:hypothetical protein
MESEALDEARDAVAERIGFLAKDASPEDLKTLAEAYANVRFGEHGGDSANHTEYAYTAVTHATTDSRAATDYKYTSFDGDRQPRSGAGFGNGS